MKKAIFSILAMALLAIPAIQANAQSKKVTKSKVSWKGYKVTGTHEGTIDLAVGYIVLKDDKFAGGKFEIDMTSIEITDLEGEYKEKLDAHLKSDDFFGVEEHPTANLTIKSYKSTGTNKYELTADITIKGVTQSITFPATVLDNKASARVKIDRTQFGIKYGSSSFFDNLKDKAISNEFDIVIEVEF